MADQNPTTPDPVPPPRVPSVIAALPSEPKPEAPKLPAPTPRPPKDPPPAPPVAPPPDASKTAEPLDPVAEEKKRWAEQYAREKAAKRRNAPQARRAVQRHRPKVHSGWMVKSPLRFRNANGGDPEDRAVGDVVGLDYFSEQDQASFLAAQAIEAHFTEVDDEDEQVEPADDEG